MFQGMIERAMARPTQRDDPEAREAGRSWAMGRLDDAMQSAANPERHASQEQQTRRKWMGNWVSTGDGEGEREPGTLFGSQPPRQATPEVGEGKLRDTLMGHFQNVADQEDGPFGPDSRLSLDGNLSQALSASGLSQSVASLRSAQAMSDSLGGGALDFRDPDRAQPSAPGSDGIGSVGDFGGGFFGRVAGRTLDALNQGMADAGRATTPSSTQQAARDSLAAGQRNTGGSAMAENMDTVQGQMKDLMSQDNSLMKQAKTQGLQQANKRGLLNSSMAVGASQDAMARNALPIAQQDAGALQDLNQLQASSMANAWGVQANNVTDIVAQGMEGIANIQSNPDIKPEDKTKMIGQITDMRDTDIAFQQDLYASLPDYLGDTGLFPNL